MAIVYVVHCIDTEGPLNESLEATFSRIKEFSGISFEPSYETLYKIQRKELNLGDKDEMLAEIFSERLLAYNRTWNDLDYMLDKITSTEYRNKYLDSYNNGWKYSWFIVDHVGYDINPRDRIIGYNAIWDHYKEYYRLHHIDDDEFQLHIHPASVYKEANRCGTSYLNSPNALKSMAHRLIDRGFFPDTYRPGVHTERPDSHWLLEQFIPYDYANQAIELSGLEENQIDLSGGRFGDWRRAPSDWRWYHPSHDDYQREGNCNRYIFRCLNVGTRIRLINQDEVYKAFARAHEGNDTVMAFCDHDFRDMSYDIEEIYEYIQNAHEKYPDVKWVNSTASEAAKSVLSEKKTPLELDVNCYCLGNERWRLVIKSNIDSFGPQPFFAVKTRSGDYRVENLDFQIPNREWSFVFDDDSIHPDDIISIGVASNSKVGSGMLVVCTLDNKILLKKSW